jgi:hypothetical protein
VSTKEIFFSAASLPALTYKGVIRTAWSKWYHPFTSSLNIYVLLKYVFNILGAQGQTPFSVFTCMSKSTQCKPLGPYVLLRSSFLFFFFKKINIPLKRQSVLCIFLGQLEFRIPSSSAHGKKKFFLTISLPQMTLN